jgi:hypothetical protein
MRTSKGCGTWPCLPRPLELARAYLRP